MITIRIGGCDYLLVAVEENAVDVGDAVVAEVAVVVSVVSGSIELAQAHRVLPDSRPPLCELCGLVGRCDQLIFALISRSIECVKERLSHADRPLTVISVRKDCPTLH